MAGLVLACVQQYCICLYLLVSGLVLVCVRSSVCLCLEISWFEFSNTIRSSVFSSIVRWQVWSSAGLCSAVLSDGWSSAGGLCSAVLSDGWSSYGLCSAVFGPNAGLCSAVL